jgi:ATP-binding cassette subfamily C protein CydC
VFRLSKNLLKLGLPRDGFFRIGLVASILQGASAVSLLGVSAWLISRAAEVDSIVYLGLAIVGVRGFAVGRAAFRYAERLLLHESAFRMLSTMRPRIFSRIAPFVPAGMNDLGRGETISRIVNDVDELQNLPLRVIATLIQAASVSALSLAFVFTLLPTDGFALAVALLIGFLVALPLSAKTSRSTDELIAPLKAKLSNLSLNLLENQDVYLAYGWMPEKMIEISKVDRELRRAISRSNISSGLGLALISLLASLGMLCGALLGGFAVTANQIPGAMLAVVTLLPMAIFELVQNAQPSISAFRKFKSSAHRIQELLERQLPPALCIESGIEMLAQVNSLQLNSAGIRYPENDLESVSNVDLRISNGSMTLLSGASGSGKSTIALALTRLINLNSGEYLINGKPVENFNLESVRNLIGLVEQNPTIFVGDVKANLLLAKPTATDAELRSVLDRVGLWRSFSSREGLSTQLGDRGVMISGGEAQRLALARALLADFQVLVMDEPTANVDSDQAID